jgi:hypothetical protein
MADRGWGAEEEFVSLLYTSLGTAYVMLASGFQALKLDRYVA